MRLKEPVKCGNPRCVRVIERSRWVCLRCWSSLPLPVREALMRCATWIHDKAPGSDTAKRCQAILHRQARLFWRGGSPRGHLWERGRAA